MRSYIFTEHERKIVKEWLRNGTELQGIRMILSRVRLFSQLKEDFELYNTIQKHLDK